MNDLSSTDLRFSSLPAMQRACCRGVVLACWVLLASGLLLTGPVASCVANETYNELIQEADLKWIGQNQLALNKALGAGNLNQANTALLSEYIRLEVLQMSLESQKETLPDIRVALKRQIDFRAKPAARDLMLAEIIKNCKLLLESDQPLSVRLNAVMLAIVLNQDKGNLANQDPPTPYMGMADLLLSVIQDPQQHPAVKVAAVNGLHRICKESEPKVDLRLKIAQTLVDQLNLPDQHEWYRMVCVQTLGFTDVINDARRRPFVIQKLAEILVDTNLGWRLRADAAYALGRVPMDSTINLPLLTYEIVRFSYEMGQRYNRNLNAPHWRYCAIRLYLVFKGEDDADNALLELVQRGAMARYNNLVTSAYQVELPLINGVLQFIPPAPVAAAKLKDIKTWLDANVPDTSSVSLDPTVKVKPLRPEKQAG